MLRCNCCIYLFLVSVQCFGSQGPTYLRELIVDGVGVVYSYGFPDPLVTTAAGDLPPNLDWKVTSKNNVSFLVSFDTIDVLPFDGSVLICEEEYYYNCASGTGACDCYSIQRTGQFVDWVPSRGPAYVLFRPTVSAGETHSRSGFRAQLQEHADKDHFFTCNQTFDITDRPNPMWFHSQGESEELFPSNSKFTDECSITLTSADGIRIRFPLATFVNPKLFTMEGLGIDDQPTSFTFEDVDTDYGYTGTVYFRHRVTIQYTFEQSEFDENIFSLTAEAFDVTPRICDTYNTRNYHNEEFDIQTYGYKMNRNYITNINCTYTLDGLSPNHQLILSLRNFDMESGADYLVANDFGEYMISGYKYQDYVPSDLNISSTSLTIMSDGIGTRSGFSGHVYIIDCTCDDGTFMLGIGNGYEFDVPVKNGLGNDYFTYCRGVTCEWTFNITDPTAEVKFSLSNYDISMYDRITLSIDGEYPENMQKNDNLTYFNVKQLQLKFVSERRFDGPAVNQGFKLRVSAVRARPTEVDLTKTSIFSYVGKIKTMQEWHFTSQKGRMAIIIMRPFHPEFSNENIYVFDGGFGGKRLTNSNSPMVASGRELALRLIGNDDDDEMVIFVSDSFVDKYGGVCGGLSTNFSTIPGCLSVFHGKASLLSIYSDVPIPAYRGISVQEEQLIHLSDTTALSLVTTTFNFAVTFKTPQNIQSGASYSVASSNKPVEISDNVVTLIVSPDYLNPKCQELCPTPDVPFPKCDQTCGFKNAVHYNGDQANVINFDLLETVGQGTLNIGDKTYTGNDGLLNVTIGNDEFTIYQSTGNEKSRLVAKAFVNPKTAH